MTASPDKHDEVLGGLIEIQKLRIDPMYGIAVREAFEENIATAIEYLETTRSHALPKHPTGISFERWLGYQPWATFAQDPNKYYTADTVRGAWVAGAQCTPSTTRRIEAELVKVDALLDELGAPVNGNWEGISAKLSRRGRIRALLSAPHGVPLPAAPDDDDNPTAPAETLEEAVRRLDKCFSLAGEWIGIQDWNRVKASALSATPCIPVSEIEAEIDHIKQNAEGLRRFAGQENEARCRELCAMYLREFIQSWKFGQQLAVMNRADGGTQA